MTMLTEAPRLKYNSIRIPNRLLITQPRENATTSQYTANLPKPVITPHLMRRFNSTQLTINPLPLASFKSFDVTNPKNVFSKTMDFLRTPITKDSRTSAGLLWGSILSLNLAIGGTFGYFETGYLKTLFDGGFYNNFAVSVALDLQYIGIITSALVPQFMLSIRSALAGDKNAPDVKPALLPSVTMQIPSRNEPFEVMKDRSLASALSIREQYPDRKLKIQVVDNSEQGKFEELQTFCVTNDIEFVHRSSLESGGKSGNLNLGMKNLDTDYVFVMDADIRLEPDALNKMMSEFVIDPKLGFVVAEAVTKNLEGKKHIFAESLENMHNMTSPLIQAADDNGFTPLAGYSTAINLSYLKEVGGWSETHVGEDYELGFRFADRLGVRGKRVSYTLAEDPALIDLDRWRTQQYRWSFGTFQTLRDYGFSILFSNKYSFYEKVSIIQRLTHYPATAFLYFLPTLAAVPLAIAGSFEGFPAYEAHPFMSALRFATPAMYVFSHALKSVSKSKDVREAAKYLRNLYERTIVGAGILMQITKASVNALIHGNDFFRITPKGKLKAQTFMQVVRKNLPEFAIGATLISPVLFGAYSFTWAALVGLGMIISPLLSWYSNYRVGKGSK